jgi:tryptophanyl-tRNA synthetase
VRRTDKGNPEVCPVYSFHKLLSSKAEQDQINLDCRQANIGCMDCKMKLAANINTFMAKPLEAKKTFVE